jgi:hypothetical protein
MEKFLYLFRGGNNSELSPDALQAHLQRWQEWMMKLGKAGIFVGGEPLARTGKQVNGTKKVVTDGPFVEAKEMIGGYMLVQVKNMEEAIEISKGCPILEVDGKLEIRPIQKMGEI